MSSSNFQTFCGSKRKLKIINEYYVDFDMLDDLGIPLRNEVKTQGWENYFKRMSGPIYPNLLKEFWVNATVDRISVNGYIIRSVVRYNLVDITPFIIARAIGCAEVGVSPERTTPNQQSLPPCAKPSSS
jgi:hypothetical protein